MTDDELYNNILLLLGVSKTNGHDEQQVIELYIKKAVNLVLRYLNNDRLSESDIKEKYYDVVIDIVVNAANLRNKKDINVKSATQGARSITYFNNSYFYITGEMAQSLPAPYVKVL